MTDQSSWAMPFPGNLKWSNATLVCQGMLPYGVVSFQQIERICQALRGRQDDPEAWPEEWSAFARKVEQQADAATAEGRRHTAGTLYLRAGNYYFTAERFLAPGERKLGIYRSALRCFQLGLRLRHPAIEFVDVPYENTALAGYFIRASDAEDAVTVVLFNGMDNCKEMSIVFAGLEFARRGINVLAVDGPGQGELLRLRKIYARPDYEVAGRAAYDFVTRQRAVPADRVVVVGYSMGGYYAPRVASLDHRFAACVAFGAMYPDFHAWQLHINRQQRDSLAKSSQSNFQLQFILGIDDHDAAMEAAKQFNLRGIAEQMRCPLLITHGAEDRVVGVDAAHQLYAMAGTSQKTLKIFTAEEGGAEHCQVDDRQMGVDFIADWIATTLPARG